jgi:DNA ligase-1
MIQCGKCNEWNPAVKECLNCQNILEQDFGKNKEKKYGKEVIKFETEKEARDYYNNCMEELQDAFNVANDFGLMAEMLLVHGRKAIEHLELVVGKPIKVMLYPKAKNIEEGFEIVGKPAMLEPKLDGFRVQIHRKKEEIKLYTRNLEEVTIQFPDVVKAVRDNVHSKEFILDSEVVGIDPKTKRVIPFQNISKRIKRKYEVEILVKSLPVVVNVFDVIELNGESLLNQSFEERRKRLKAIIHDEKGKMELIEQVITGDVEKTKKYYQECLEKGHEGIMMKSIQGIYKPGKRVGQGVKIKPVMESLDLVIVGAEWGEGKRANWLSSFIVACKDGDQLKEIGKVGSGLKEKAEEGVSYDELTEELKKNIIQEKGREVKLKPKVVVEIVFEEIQQSPSYSSGYALRFPRILRLREDKGVRDISTLKEIEKIYQEQK